MWLIVVLEMLLFQLSFYYMSIVTRPQVQAIAVQRVCSFDEAKVKQMIL